GCAAEQWPATPFPPKAGCFRRAACVLDDAVSTGQAGEGQHGDFDFPFACDLARTQWYQNIVRANSGSHYVAHIARPVLRKRSTKKRAELAFRPSEGTNDLLRLRLSDGRLEAVSEIRTVG